MNDSNTLIIVMFFLVQILLIGLTIFVIYKLYKKLKNK